MAVRDDFAAGEVLSATDLNDTFSDKATVSALAEKLPYSYGTATPSTTDSGFLWYDSNSTPAAPKFWDGSAFQALTSGKILQIVRATDATQRSTTSTSFVDASISVTITPQKSDSAILLLWSFIGSPDRLSSGDAAVNYQITDNSNNAISGAEASGFRANSVLFVIASQLLIGYATPATTSATIYKGRFRAVNVSSTAYIYNSSSTGQMYAIEVSA